MDRADFIITVYCLVCDQYQMIKSQPKIRRGGFAPTLTDEEVITIELCGEFFKLHSDEDIFDHFSEYSVIIKMMLDFSLHLKKIYLEV